MMLRFLLVLLFLEAFIVSVNCHCPDQDVGLVKWSDHKNTWNDLPPAENGNVTITEGILLDEQPPTLWSIHITSTGKLVWDPNTEVHLKIHWIQVDGELHIGHENCPYEQNTHITFLGNVNENDLGAGGDKALFVTDGGTLEIHGKPKLSWTKLAETAPKYVEEAGTILEMMNRGPDNVVKGKGIAIYSINPTTGGMTDSAYFNFNVMARSYPGLVLSFVDFLNDIPTGNVVGIALKRELIRRGDLSGIFEAIEILTGQTTGTNPLRNDVEATYALLTIKGSPDTSIEVHTPWDSNDKSLSEVSMIIRDFIIVLKSVMTSSNMGFTRVLVAIYDQFRPTLTLIDDASSWQTGDKLIIASTDYDWRQAEEMTVIDCDSCEDNQVRLAAPLKFTHYGEIYKNVDMRGEVGLLTRNVLFDSEDAEGSTTYGGNLKVLKGFKSVHIENAEFDDLGQQEVLGRYPLHFHMCEDVDQDDATRPWLKHNSIHHSNSRCITVHGTHGLILEDNVCYMTKGHGYFLEDGGEKRTVIDGNLGLGQEKGSLIKADKAPSTFWITNPNVHVRNNVAAGASGRGYWFTYPRLPLAPSADKGYMRHGEARLTAITEFYNNVAHSNRMNGFHVDNEFNEDTSATGYNRYMPKADPLMHLEFGNSTDAPAVFTRMTGYKNSPRNAWMRGGMLKIVQSSFADSAQLLTIVKENKAVQMVEESVFIGDSPNLGEPAIIDGTPVSIGRSFPAGMANNLDKMTMGTWRRGLVYFRGPMYVRDVFFDNFASNEYYKMGAIGFKSQGNPRGSPMSAISNAKFGFADPTEGNRIMVLPRDESEEIRNDERSLRDTDNSVTGIEGVTGTVTALNRYPLHLTNNCKIRSNWNFAYCKHVYGQVDIIHKTSDSEITITRDDDYMNARTDENERNTASFLAVVGEGYGYSVFWEDEVPDNILLVGRAISRSQTVRIGMCLPPGATFKIMGKYPSIVNPRGFQEVASLDDLSDKGQYFFDSETGYLAILMIADGEFESGQYGNCPGSGSEKGCPSVRVLVLSGDLTDTDCLAAAHAKLKLSSNTSVSRRRLHTLLDILNARLNKLNQQSRAKRSVDDDDDMYDTRTIPATDTEPPANWGAGATR